MKAVLLSLLFLTPCLAAAQDAGFEQQKDSLLSVIAQTQGDEKLKNYRQFQIWLFHYEPDMDSVCKYYDEYIKEARKQGNTKDEGMVYVNLLGAYCNRGLFDKAIAQSDEILQFLSSSDLWEYYYQAYSIVLEACFFNNQYQKTLDAANELYRQAKEQNHANGISAAFYTMGLVYNKTERTQEAEQYFKKCIETQERMEKKTALWTQAYYYLFEIIEGQKRYSEAGKLLAEWEKAVKSYEIQEDLENAVARNELYTAKVRLYLNEGELDKAELYCDSAEITSPDNSLLANTTFLRALIMEKRKDYTQAIELLDIACQLFTTYEEWGVVIEILSAKSRVLLAKDGNTEVYPLFETILARKDSLKNLDFHAQLDDLRIEYEVDRHIAEKERTRNYLLFALAGCGILALALGVWIYYTRLVRRKNRSLYLRIQELTHIEKTAEEQLLQAPEENLSREMQIFRRLSQCMQNEKLFTNPVLNRKMLAAHTNTNEAYLADAIRRATGETVSAYISGLRLQYALKLLDEHPGMTLDAVAIDSGHGSYSPFFRSFTKKYGITPSEYRKMSGTKNNN
ncbi:MAG: helix-turn-helix domain-containing protein [Tannerellaceae bacterium]|jgi:AraC-like DNA-binding protein|nr:helix-turn-helix domain-containing protein [Tannerellaceae bacterium]